MTAQKDIPSKSSVTPYEATVIGGGGGGSEVEFNISEGYDGGTTQAFTIKIGTDEKTFTMKQWDSEAFYSSDIIKVTADAHTGDQMGFEKITTSDGAEIVGGFGMCIFREPGSAAAPLYDTTFSITAMIKLAGQTTYYPVIYMKSHQDTAGGSNYLQFGYWNGTATAVATIQEVDLGGVFNGHHHRWV